MHRQVEMHLNRAHVLPQRFSSIGAQSFHCTHRYIQVMSKRVETPSHWFLRRRVQPMRDTQQICYV